MSDRMPPSVHERHRRALAEAWDCAREAGSLAEAGKMQDANTLANLAQAWALIAQAAPHPGSDAEDD